MIKTSELTNLPPKEYKSELQKAVYDCFANLGIEFARVDNEPAITMEDCLAIDEALKVKTIKTILLNNQQKTIFYLFVTPGDKRFDCKAFSKAMGIARTSFSNADKFHELLHAEIGAASIFSILLDTDNKINVVLDEDILKCEMNGYSDGTTTSYLKISTKDLIDKFIPYTKHSYQVIHL